MSTEAPISLVLLGDSVLDNKAYTHGGPDVAAHLRDLFPAPSRVTRCAVDGTTTSTLGVQLDRVPDNATHIVLSLGGNDALENADLLGIPCRSTGDALDLFAERMQAFEPAYGWALDAVVDLGHPVTVCTIYDGSLPNREAPRARVALMMFNDVILRAAFERALNVIDLRLVCREDSDFERGIEPSTSGGAKIAHAVATAIPPKPPPTRATRVTLGPHEENA